MTRFFSRVLHADLDTPVSVYLKLEHDHAWAACYESVEGRAVWASYSILAFGARRTIEVRDGSATIQRGRTETERVATGDPLQALRDEIRAYPLSAGDDRGPPFLGGLFGFVSYDSVRFFEPVKATPHPVVPDALFFEPELYAVFDNRRHTLTLYALDEATLERAAQQIRQPLPPRPDPQRRPWVEPHVTPNREVYCAEVERAKEHIRAGDIIQVVLSRRFELPKLTDPFEVYRALRTVNPSPYLYYIKSPHICLAGASPEVMLRVSKGGLSVRPIAGTRPRGTTPSEDADLARSLLADEKERAEHIMLVDLGRNDLGRVSELGSVHVNELMVVEHYSHVMHLVSQVSGQLRSDLDAFDAVRAAFPAGTLSGAPKVRAMNIIADIEARPRGIYAGAVGYFGPRGDADFGIAIRTLEAYQDRFVLQAGAGIVADSDPAREADETEHKAEAVLAAVRWALGQGHEGDTRGGGAA